MMINKITKKFDIISKIDEECRGFFEWNKPLYLITAHDKRSKEFIKQKKKYGFSDDETWSLDATIVIFILPRLKRFRDIIADGAGYPTDLTKDEWVSILNKMIEAFELMFKECIDGYIITEDDQKKINQGLHLFADYFQALWW